MRISLNWLKQYIDLTISPSELAHHLTMVGLEVENIEYLGEKYKNFFVGEVLKVEKHPKADELVICEVSTGSEKYQIVCGAPNVTSGQKVAVGLIGATVPRNQHDPDGKPFTLSQVKLRGVDSFGMICSEYELELGEDKEGIMVLPPDTIAGIPLAEYLHLDDIIFEVGITPNRPDAMSHLGIAREVGALLNRELKIPKIELKESNEPISKFATVDVLDSVNCPRYTARVVMDMKIGPSPEWMQNRLKAVDIRPVNNIVDITNYVLMECGHPLHAFDCDKIFDHKIIVKCATNKESFTTLDHKVRILQSDTLMICDGKLPIAIAGVMGGENTEISDATTKIILESAYFNPRSIRRTSKYFGFNTDASQRFERGADPNITTWAVDRAAQLINEICGGKTLQGRIDTYPERISEKEINLRIKTTNDVLGLSLSATTISDLLSKFGIQLIDDGSKNSAKDILRFSVPTFRPDIEREIDLIEEVARAYGYDNIELKMTSSVHFLHDHHSFEYIDELRQHIIGCGMMEVVTNSMQDVSVASLTTDNIVKIANPISKDMEAMRSSLIPSLLDIIHHNIDHGIANLRLFEIGKVYFHNHTPNEFQVIRGYSEKDRVVFAFSGNAYPSSWDQKPRSLDIFDIKGEILTLFEKISLDNIKFIPYSTTDALTEYGLTVEINGEYAGLIGVIRSVILSKFKIEQDVIISEFNVNVLERNRSKKKQFKALPKFPVVTRDIAIVVDDVLEIEKIESEIKSAGGKILTKLQLFDIYTGDQISQGKKSCAYGLELMAEDHTMTQDEIDKVMQKIIDRIQNNLNGTIRK